MSETNESGQAPDRDHASTSNATDPLPVSDSESDPTPVHESGLNPEPPGQRPPADADTAPTSTDAPEQPPAPADFEQLGLPPTLREAVAALGWRVPTPVQARTFQPMATGADVLVQSHTGSGKTGAFCLPWLATRFQPGSARESGVQLLVLLPTRELAKQVCTELVKLAVESPVDVLPVYGGTAIVPQLDALRRGVHAVVGTPGRILDHIRRRSLDLSKVRTVVLDECDEMLSMGFLEDIRSILETCPRERQTCLFSATVPTDIARIAKRYMRDPVRIELSGDQVAAAEIDHAYYQAASPIKTRDLLDVIMVEDPTRAIVFCNTREEVKLVASVLQREGYSAEMLSSDLTQAQRERVMAAMREHRLRFLVATDVAARGIDISDISHVINYSFPESPDVYVHRTGRTGRAGRPGIAISLIASTEVGNFYLLKKLHPSIRFEERTLPPADELAAQRMEVKLDAVSLLFPELVSPEWTVLARSLTKDPRGERVVAYLLSEGMRATQGRRRSVEPAEPTDAVQAAEPTLDDDEREQRARRARDRRERYDREDREDDEDRGRRRRHRRRGGRDGRDGERVSERARQPMAESPDAAESPAARATGPGEAAAGLETPTARAELPHEATQGDEDGAPKKRRRRRRRRRGKGGRPDEAAAPTEGEPSVAEVTAEGGVSASTPAPGEPTAQDGEARRRRRRRRKPRPEGASTDAASIPPPPPSTKVSQDSIVIDIDESELEVVRTEFGEIDELGDLTLKGRRRAVMDELADEVVLEDMSGADAEREGEDDDADEEVDPTALEAGPAPESTTSTAPAGPPVEAATDASTESAEDAVQKKRRRRRRRKKAAPVVPELTAPPHKDFWEVWAAKYSTKDFERESDDQVEVEETPVARPVVDEAEEPVDEADLVRVRLNVGRAHGRKSAAVRGLLADRCGLRGKAVRDLTVRDQDTLFRMPGARFDDVVSALQGQMLEGVALAIERVDEEGVVLRIDEGGPGPDAADDEAATTDNADDDGAADRIPTA